MKPDRWLRCSVAAVPVCDMRVATVNLPFWVDIDGCSYKGSAEQINLCT
jgi:hypothetical protein